MVEGIEGILTRYRSYSLYCGAFVLTTPRGRNRRAHFVEIGKVAPGIPGGVSDIQAIGRRAAAKHLLMNRGPK